jgi:hypothetical protein
MENCKRVANGLNNIAALNLSGAIDKGQGNYFQKDNRTMLTLSESENESNNEEFPDLGKIIFIEKDIVESSDDSDGEETVINSVGVTEEVDRVLKSVECLVEEENVKGRSREG